MEKTVRMMMDLIASEACGKEIDPKEYALSDEELKDLYRLSKFHDLAHLVGNALIQKDLIRNAEIRQRFEKQVMTAVYRYERTNYELQRLCDTLNEAKIPFIPLKGSVIRNCYPEPWMRTSCDIDILVREQDLETAAQAIGEKLGYRYESRNYHDISLKSESGVHLELHFSLKENEENIDGLLSDCWQYAFVHRAYEYSFTPEFFLFHQFAHASYHFLHGGCGVRILLDICILERFLPCDRAKLEGLLEKCGILKFAHEVEHLANIWFGTAEYTEISRQMERYLLSGGVYGTTGNRVAVQQAQKGGKMRYALSRIWLPYSSLKNFYPSLEGKAILLPFYEMRRWGRFLIGGKAKRGLEELKLNAGTTMEGQSQIMSMLEKLELRP